MLKLNTLISVATLAAALATAAQPARPPAPATPDGKTLVVPNHHKSQGDVYYAITDKDRQIYFESNAPLENIKGQSNDVIGYAVFSPNRPGKLVAAEWRLPVASMKTGIELRDEHLAGKDWLDAGSHPNIVVQVRSFKDVKETKRSASFTTYTGVLVVDLTMHGVTRPMEIPGASVTLMPESNATRRVAKGDLMAIRAKFTVTLADHEIKHPVIGEKVAKDVDIDVSLFLSTLPPAHQ
jgi:polyisoprenoid-binding protein YceI